MATAEEAFGEEGLAALAGPGEIPGGVRPEPRPDTKRLATTFGEDKEAILFGDERRLFGFVYFCVFRVW